MVINLYEIQAQQDLIKWKARMRKKPFITDRITKGLQNKMNDLLPKKYHEIMTATVKNLTRAVLYGSQFISMPPIRKLGLDQRESMLREKIKTYKATAMVEGAATGAGGILLGLTDFPLLLSIKIKFLFDAASIYGFDVNDYTERIYILYIFQLAFSSREHAAKIFDRMEHWQQHKKLLSENLNNFDWETFQREYRDYIDLAKFMQLIPGIGAAAGFIANHRLMNRLSETAIRSYRMRFLSNT